MREILFRGRRIDNEEWIEGDLAHSHGRTYCGFYFETISQVDPATVGQFTGLKDKNGKRIFEGDIFQCNDARGYVRFGTYASAYSSGDTHVGFFIEWIVDRMLRIDLAFWTNQREIEVIGNIHDNPELLEV